MLLFAGSLLAVVLAYRHEERLLQHQALQHAADYTAAISEFRTLYTSEVVETVLAQGLHVSHDFTSKNDAIPLPVTLSLLLGERVSATGGGQVFIYSP